MSFSLSILLMINKIPLHGTLFFHSQGSSEVFQLAAWLQSVVDGHGHAQGLLQIVYCQNKTLRLSEGTLLSSYKISASDQTTVAMGDPCVRVSLCVWNEWCEDTQLGLHLSLGLDAALKVRVQTLEPGSWLMGRERLAASRYTVHHVMKKEHSSAGVWICSLLALCNILRLTKGLWCHCSLVHMLSISIKNLCHNSASKTQCW